MCRHRRARHVTAFLMPAHELRCPGMMSCSSPGAPGTRLGGAGSDALRGEREDRPLNRAVGLLGFGVVLVFRLAFERPLGHDCLLHLRVR
jgi:hypothetical protein